MDLSWSLVPALSAAFTRQEADRPDAIGVQSLLAEHADPGWRIGTIGATPDATQGRPAWIYPSVVAGMLVLLVSSVVLLVAGGPSPIVAGGESTTTAADTGSPTASDGDSTETESGDGGDGEASVSTDAVEASGATAGADEADQGDPTAVIDRYVGVWSGEIELDTGETPRIALVIDEALAAEGESN